MKPPVCTILNVSVFDTEIVPLQPWFLTRSRSNETVWPLVALVLMPWPATWTLLAARVLATALAASAVAAAPVSFPVAATLGLALVLAGAGAVVAPVACDAGDVAAAWRAGGRRTASARQGGAHDRADATMA